MIDESVIQYMLGYMHDFMPKVGSHGIWHSVRVLKMAKVIAKEFPDVNMGELTIACYMHDVGRGSATTDHAKMGAQITTGLLKQLGVERDVRDRIANAILCHRYRSKYVPETNLAKVLYDADKLDILGAIGVARLFYDDGHTGADMFKIMDTREYENGHETIYSSIMEYRSKLIHLPDHMLTNTGFKLAVQKAEIMDRFFAELDSELDGSWLE